VTIEIAQDGGGLTKEKVEFEGRSSLEGRRARPPRASLL